MMRNGERNGMAYTLSEAAEETGRSRSTIHRAIKAGRLSAQREEGGTYRIDGAELARVFPGDGHGRGKRDDREQGRNSADVLAVKVEMLEELLRRERETVDDLRRRLDRAEERAFALAAPVVRGEGMVGLLGRLRGWARPRA